MQSCSFQELRRFVGTAPTASLASLARFCNEPTAHLRELRSCTLHCRDTRGRGEKPRGDNGLHVLHGLPQLIRSPIMDLSVQRDRAESLEASRPAERRLIWEQALDELSRLRCGLNLGGSEENHFISPAQA